MRALPFSIGLDSREGRRVTDWRVGPATNRTRGVTIVLRTRWLRVC